MEHNQGKINGNHPLPVNPIVLENSPLKMFHIFHAINKVFMYTEKLEQPRKYVGWVMAKDLNDAWEKAQNDFNSDYARYGARSTSVGDVIQDPEALYLVKNTGFEKICDLNDEGQE